MVGVQGGGLAALQIISEIHAVTVSVDLSIDATICDLKWSLYASQKYVHATRMVFCIQQGLIHAYRLFVVLHTPSELSAKLLQFQTKV